MVTVPNIWVSPVISTVPNISVDPVTSNDPESVISYASVPVKASTDWETCHDWIVKFCTTSSTAGSNIFFNTFAI